MNERVKKLLLELHDPVGYIGNWGRVQWADNVYPQLGDDLYAGVDLEKFAELILKETIFVLQKRFMGDLNREDLEVHRCVEDLKKHFGVQDETK